MTLVADPPAPEGIQAPPRGRGHELAELIRAGCLLSPEQEFDALFRPGSSCVMGALYEGLLGIGPGASWFDRPGFVWPDLRGTLQERVGIDILQNIQHPLRPHERYWTLSAVMVDLNNNYRWSRERIATWIEEVLR